MGKTGTRGVSKVGHSAGNVFRSQDGTKIKAKAMGPKFPERLEIAKLKRTDSGEVEISEEY